MKVILTLLGACLLTVGCSQYDPYRITQTERHKQSAHEGVRAAMQGKLSRTEYKSILQSFDTSLLEEQAKDGSGLEELKKKSDVDTEKKVVEIFGEE